MSMKENLPFQRGQTYYGGTVVDATAHADLEGREYVIVDDNQNANGGVGTNRTGREIRLRIVRNLSGAALLPRKLVLMKTDGAGNQYAGQVSGYTAATGDKGYAVDEYLPAAGVVANDLFYVVIKGPAQCITDSAGTTNIPTGGVVVAGTGTAGNVVLQNATPADSTAAMLQVNGKIGRAILGLNATATAILIDIDG